MLKKKTKVKPIPKFKNEDEERDFWDKNDPFEYFDKKTYKKVSFPNLKPSIKTISLRLPENMIEELKVIAHKSDIPYQSLIKIILHDRIKEEFSMSK